MRLELGALSIPMEMFMKENSKILKKMVMENTLLKIKTVTKEISRMICFWEREGYLLRMVINMKENF